MQKTSLKYSVDFRVPKGCRAAILSPGIPREITTAFHSGVRHSFRQQEAEPIDIDVAADDDSDPLALYPRLHLPRGSQTEAAATSLKAARLRAVIQFGWRKARLFDYEI